MPMLLKNLTFPPKLTAQNPQNAPSRAKNMGRLKIPVFLTPGRECIITPCIPLYITVAVSVYLA
mgnify:CR=1 FL=1